jgi:hypothetical protein
MQIGLMTAADEMGGTVSRHFFFSAFTSGNVVNA